MNCSGSIWEKAERLKMLPPYLFVEIDRTKMKLIQQGKDLIDLGIGDPDLATPEEIVEELNLIARNSQNHHYPLDRGIKELRVEIAVWMKNRFGIELDPEREILPLLGSKEGIAHFPLSFLNPGDLALIPEPLYPPYRSGTIFAGAEIIYLPLEADNNFLPQLSSLDSDILKNAKLLYLNYPNNPTTAVVEKDFLKKIVQLAREFQFCILYDAAYSEMTFDGYQAPSILEIEGAREVAIEFHSFSKTYNMTGWRIGWACGNQFLVECLRELKSNIDSGIFNPIQYAGIKALKIYHSHIRKLRNIYQERRDTFLKELNKLGWKIAYPSATFYIWAKVPLPMTSGKFVKLLLEKAHIVATPGIGFGPSGEGYIRFALTTSKERLQEAASRIARVL